MITHHLTLKRIQTTANFSGAIQIRQAMHSQLDHIYHHVTRTLWIHQQSHERQLPKLTKKNTEKRGIVLNARNKATWPGIAWTDPVDWHMHAL
jgi:hypothetical protein